MSDGMVVTFAEEILRAVQNPIPLYQAVPSAHATTPPDDRILSTSYHAYSDTFYNVVPWVVGYVSLVGATTMVHACGMAKPFLGR
jgi:hypothetical protein